MRCARLGGARRLSVSRSAWNIHALLKHFIRHQDLPEGPLILRDVQLLNRPERRRGHKRREIERIFATYSALPFVLIRDSGQGGRAHLCRRRASASRACARHSHSQRVLGRRKQKLLTELQARCPDVPVLVFDHAREAKRYCQQLGLCALPE